MSDATLETKSIYILHIEDDDTIIKGVGRLLRRVFGAEVVSVKSMNEVKAVVGKHSWAAVISDWNIEGGMTGGDVYNMIQIEYPDITSRYIFMSDNPLAQLLAKAVNVPYLEKPASSKDICEALQTLGISRE